MKKVLLYIAAALLPIALQVVIAHLAAATASAESNDPATVFGAGWTADSLANLEIGRFSGRSVSYRFRALHSGTVSNLRVFFIFRKVCDGCYANGNGGQVTIQLAQDDGTSRHTPGNVLSSALVTDPMKQWNRLITLDHPVSVESGKLYHIVFTNPLLSSTKDYVSVDDLFSRTDGVDLQPSAQAAELAVLFKSTGGSEWEVKNQHVPIFSLNFDDGFRQGQGYMDVKTNAVRITGDEAARESFVFSGPDQSFQRLAVRLLPTKATGNLVIQLQDAIGQVLASGKVAVHSVPQNATWQVLDFQPPVLLKKLGRYSVVATVEDGAEFSITPLQKGTQYGFDTNTLFTAGHCEAKLSSAWAGCMGRLDLDIPFYLQ